MKLYKISEDNENKRVNYLLKYKDKYVVFYTVQVEPVVIIPECIKQGFEEDCFKCNISDSCMSPRGWCIKPCRGHPKGCINRGNKEGCPPNVPMFYDVFDIDKPIYLGINDYDLMEHERKYIINHPTWNKNELRNSRHYQPYMEGINNAALREWIKDYPDLVVTNWIESMGVDLVNTLIHHGIELKFGKDMDITRRIILMGSLIPNTCENNDVVVTNQNNIKILRLKKYI